MAIDLAKILPFPPNPVQMAAGGIQVPKLSELVKPFADIESQIQESISAATGISPPPGPATTLLTLAEMVESGKEGPPTSGAAGATGAGESTGTQVVTVEVPAEPISPARIESMETQGGGEEVPGTPVPRIY